MNTKSVYQRPPQNFNLHYQVECFDPHAHLFKVTLTIFKPSQNQIVSLPTWIPGSYLVRDFAKHLVEVQAIDLQGNPVEMQPEGLSSWCINAETPFQIIYFVYAWDLSVRKAHFDQTHAFFNGTSLFLAVEGQRHCPAKVTLEPNAFTQTENWKASTGMAILDVDQNGFGDYWSNDFRDLVEYPFEIGNYQQIEFEAYGVPHKMVFTGRLNPNTDFERIKQDVQKICETEIEFFGLDSPHNPPVQHYLFQVMVTTADYGGLEHLNSTALICSRDDLAYNGMEQANDGYLQFLELCSHEYFHTWNVKRIQPLAYQDSDLNTPAISRQLWWFEGVTSYYDALFLLKSGLIDENAYLNLLGKQLSKIYMMPGRLKQSVAESSFYTWTKFYQQDENAPNSIISYYTKGSLIALALDLTLRKETQNQLCLDGVLRYLWKEYGSQNNGSGKGLAEKQIENICSEMCQQNGGNSLEAFFEQAIYSTEDLPLAELFSQFNYDFILRPAQDSSDMGGNLTTEALETLQSQPPATLGARFQDSPSASVSVTHVWNDQAAYNAGLSKNDEIIAINGIRIRSKSQIEKLLKRHNGQTWQCHYFRRDELYQTSLKPLPAPLDRVTIQCKTDKEGTSLTWLKESK